MAYNTRITSILSIIARKRSVTVQELKERLGVSEVTIRKDLDLLEGEGAIVRTHGGAMMAEERSGAGLRTVTMREQVNVDEKRAIARLARSLVADGDTIYLDAGSTCRLLAQELRGCEIQVVTNSLDVINELADAENVSLHIPGGSFRRKSRSLIGPSAMQAMENMNITTCFMGTTGFLPDGVFSSQNTLETQLKRQAIKASRRCVMLADAAKYGVSAFSVFARAEDVDILITDWRFQDARRMAELDIEVMIADMDLTP